MARVRLSNIQKRYQNVEVIRGVDIDIDDGEFTVFVGPSGCGKSTLLRMIAGLDSPSSGDILIGERIVNLLPPKERGISMVFQSYALYPHMTVGENLGFGLKIAGSAVAAIHEKVATASKMLGLDALLDRLPRQLSGGQRQRVAMGRAMVRNPKVFLFDEPLSNLDAKLRVQMRAEIRALHQRLGTTSVYVTHDQIEAMTMADRIVVLRDGRVEQAGTPVALYDRPCNTFVATFIGAPSMNLLPGRIGADGLRVRLDAGGEVVLPAPLQPAGDAAVLLGVRPEHIASVPTGTVGAVVARARFAEFTGADSLLSCEVGGTACQAVLRERLAVTDGEPVALLFERAHLHVFDAATGLRLAAAP